MSRTGRAARWHAPCEAGESGAMALWVLGLALALLAVGGITVDLWRVTTQRRVLAAAVDAAAAAGAGALDIAHLRAHDELQLDPVEARRMAEATLAALDPAGVTAYAATATPSSVVVVAEAEVPITLLRLVQPNAAPVSVRVEAIATPRASP